MDIHDRHFGAITTKADTVGAPEIDLNVLLIRLLLFEQVHLETAFLLEVPAMLKCFGFEGTVALIRHPALRLVTNALTVGSVGQSFPDVRHGRAVLPLGSYSFAIVEQQNSPKVFVDQIMTAPEISNLSQKRRHRILELLESKVSKTPTAAADEALIGFEKKLQESQGLLLLEARQELASQFEVSEREIELAVETLDTTGQDFKISSNLTKFGLPTEKEHELVGRVFLTLSGLDVALQIMRHMRVVSGFKTTEMPYVKRRIDGLLTYLDPDRQEERLTRVTTLAGLPEIDLSGSAPIDLRRLLKVRDTPECRDFRTWLRAIDSVEDVELQDRFASTSEQITSVIASKPVRTLRFLITNVLPNFLPAGNALGLGMAVADEFLIGKLVTKPGPISFLGNEYKSIFG